MALSDELNRRLTEVGPGTPGGNLLRRYWMPLLPERELTGEYATQRVRLLGEDLVVYRTTAGKYGLVPERCPHRGASLLHGFVDGEGIRCPYHGWKFGLSGACLEMPFEKSPGNIMRLAARPPYRVESLAGLLWGYIGPQPAPLLPRWELLVDKRGTRDVTVLPLHACNYLQAQENSCDPTHVYYLHAETLRHQSPEIQAKFRGAIEYFGRPIEDFDFQLISEPAYAGIRKIREYGGANSARETGHPAIFPNILVAPQDGGLTMHFRVPVDDTHTRIFWVNFTESPGREPVEQRDDEIPVTYVQHPLRADGRYDLTSFIAQDLMAWETQGAVYDRQGEILGASDRGITMWRKLLREQIDAVEQGRDPAGVVRDPSLNEIIRFNVTDRDRIDVEPAGLG